MPLVREFLEPQIRHWAVMREILEGGWSGDGHRRDLFRAALGHALNFYTWQSLVREQGLEDEEAIALLVGMVRCIASDGST
jgi:hypothetical protein